jgi:hypothetical protein
MRRNRLALLVTLTRAAYRTCPLNVLFADGACSPPGFHPPGKGPTSHFTPESARRVGVTTGLPTQLTELARLWREQPVSRPACRPSASTGHTQGGQEARLRPLGWLRGSHQTVARYLCANRSLPRALCGTTVVNAWRGLLAPRGKPGAETPSGTPAPAPTREPAGSRSAKPHRTRKPPPYEHGGGLASAACVALVAAKTYFVASTSASASAGSSTTSSPLISV